jgi:hypothetical protein
VAEVPYLRLNVKEEDTGILNNSISWDVMPFIEVKVNRRFGGMGYTDR